MALILYHLQRTQMRALYNFTLNFIPLIRSKQFKAREENPKEHT